MLKGDESMHGAAGGIGLLIKGVMLGMSLGAAIYSDKRGGAAASGGELLKEVVKVLAQSSTGHGKHGHRR